jgi:exopolysaccharide biosynthesis protein
MKYILIFIFIFFPLCHISAASLGQSLAGRILLNTEKNGEAWYVHPTTYKRYFLGRPVDAFRVMRELGVGIKEIDFQKLASAGMPIAGDTALAKRLSGKIILEVEKNGEAWYINPIDLKKYYLGRPEDAFNLMRQLALGISRENLALVHKPGLDESINQYSKYEQKTIKTAEGDFKVDLIEIDLANPKLKIVTDVVEPFPTASTSKEKGVFGAASLAKLVTKNNGFAGINGTYFCSYSNCGGKNYYFYPVFSSRTGQMVNASELKYWTTGPIFAFDANNKFYYFKDSREFKSVKDFETNYGVKLQAAIGNKPRLIQDYMNYLIEWEMDQKQLKEKLIRNAIGYKDNKIYLAITYNATIENLATVMQTLGMQYALNLDGGYSAALWYNDEYMVGPGRNIPNAIVFAGK